MKKKHLTVIELIEKLQRLPPDLLVLAEGCHCEIPADGALVLDTHRIDTSILKRAKSTVRTLTLENNCPNCHNHSLENFLGPVPVNYPDARMVESLRCPICNHFFMIDADTKELLEEGG